MWSVKCEMCGVWKCWVVSDVRSGELEFLMEKVEGIFMIQFSILFTQMDGLETSEDGFATILMVFKLTERMFFRKKEDHHFVLGEVCLDLLKK